MKNQQKQNNIEVTLQDLNVAYESYFNVDDDVIFPLYVHISLINDINTSNKQIKLDMLKNKIRLNKTDSPFKREYELFEMKEMFIHYLSFIDRRKLFENQTMNYFELFCGEDDVNKFYDKLIEMGFSNLLFIRLRDELEQYIRLVKTEFIEKCQLFLDYNRDFPSEIKSKDKIPEQYQKHMIYPMNMTMVQPSLEYSNTIIFSENINKPFSEWSWRESQFKSMYISMKYKIEGFTTNYQIWKMEKDRQK